jgi:hypothetical protein
MAVCICGLPAHCCQPAVAGGFIYADLWGELSTHLVLQVLFTQSSPVCEPLLQAFPFPSTLGEVTLHPLSQACVFVYSVCLQLTWEVGLPPSPVEFSSLRHSHKLSHSWLLGVAPTPVGASPVRPGLFIYSSGKDSPSLLFSIQCAPSSLQRVFIVLIAYYSVSLFSLGWSWSVQGAMLFLPRVVCGSTTYRLAHLVRVFPSRLGVGDWRPGGPSGFPI